MSKINVEYGYFEAMEEIIKDKNKVFIRVGFEEEDVMKISMLFNQKENNIDIIEDYLKTEVIGGGNKLKLRINDKWTNSKWILVEEVKTYNIRVYNIDSGRLISSEIVVMTKEEIENYRKELFNKGKVEEDIKSGIGKGIVLFKINKYEHEIVSEEIITN